jgi:hypothetical protein
VHQNNVKCSGSVQESLGTKIQNCGRRSRDKSCTNEPIGVQAARLSSEVWSQKNVLIGVPPTLLQWAGLVGPLSCESPTIPIYGCAFTCTDPVSHPLQRPYLRGWAHGSAPSPRSFCTLTRICSSSVSILFYPRPLPLFRATKYALCSGQLFRRRSPHFSVS